MATPVLCCGMECGQVGAGLHFESLENASFVTTTVRTGTRALRINPTAAHGKVTLPTFGTPTVIVGRFYVRWATLPTADTNIASVTGEEHGVCFKASDSKLYAGSNTSTPLFGATGVAVTTNTWYRVDLRVDVSANPHTTDVRVDGTACAQYTESLAAATLSNFQFGSSNTRTYDAYLDDVLFSLAAGDYPLGAGAVSHFVPTADGTHNVAGAGDFEAMPASVDILNTTTDAYTNVDDVPMESAINDHILVLAPPAATDYVEVVFGPAPGISTPTTAPRAVDVAVAYHAAANQSGNLRLALNDNGTTNDVLNKTGNGPTALTYARKHYATAPTGGAWTLSGAGNFNNLRMRCYSSDAAPDQMFDCAMIEAEFAEVATKAPPPFLLQRQPRFLPTRRVI